MTIHVVIGVNDILPIKVTMLVSLLYVHSRRPNLNTAGEHDHNTQTSPLVVLASNLKMNITMIKTHTKNITQQKAQ